MQTSQLELREINHLTFLDTRYPKQHTMVKCDTILQSQMQIKLLGGQCCEQ